MKRSALTSIALFVLALTAGAHGAPQAQERMMAPPPDTDAVQPEEGEPLTRPDIERWIYLGTTVGHGPIRAGAKRTFGPDNPGQILVTQMEPGAYDYFRKHGRYADGTTFAVSFFDPVEKPDPEMNGLVAGDRTTLVVHRLERTEAGRRHDFYMFENGMATATRMPERVPCVACHTKAGAYDGTFIQFYPALRERWKKQD